MKQSVAVHDVSVCKSSIPTFLQQGDFFRSLADNDCPDEQISVPHNTIKPDQTVSSEDDLIHLLTSLRYWLVSEPQITIFEFCLSNNMNSPVIDQFEPCFPYLSLFRTLHTVESAETMDCAVKFGDVDVLKMMLQHGYAFGERSTQSAVLSGNIDCITFVLENGCSITERDFSLAASGGQLATLQLMHRLTHTPEKFQGVCSAAASGGHLECVKFLQENNYRCNYEAAMSATANGHLHVLEYMSMFPPSHFWFQGSARVAAQKGHIEIIEFFNSHNYPWNEQTAMWCAGSGQLAALQHLHENGCPWDFSTCLSAVYDNHFECLKYAVEHGCEWTEDMEEDLKPEASQEMRDFVANLPKE